MDELVQRILEFHRARGRWPSAHSVRGWASPRLSLARAEAIIKEAQRQAEEAGHEAPDIVLPPPIAPDLSRWPTLPPGVLVLGDLHIPAHDPTWIEYAVRQARGLGIRRLLIAGDLVDATHVAPWPTERHYSLEDELEIAHSLVAALAQVMDEIHILPGNHDDRAAKRLDRELTTRGILDAYVKRGLPGVHVHWHHHAYVGRSWLVAHPRAYSRAAPAVARDLAAIHHRHVAMGHDHAVALGWDVSGRYMAISIGMCADPGRLAYRHRDLGRHPTPRQGALIILPDERARLLATGLA